jgi:secondary thiamine-phosphate synthase enzyme
MSWFQKSLTLPSKSRGSYLITDTIVKELPEIKTYKVGLLNLFIQHTSCALSLNENWDEDVREDMSDALDRIAPEDREGKLYRHSAEGLDDMPVSFGLVSYSHFNFQLKKWGRGERDGRS